MEHEWTVGIDRGSEAHQICVLDAERTVVGERVVEHRSEALSNLVRWLLELAGGEPDRLAVAIEVPRGAVVETLLDHDVAVYSLNPKQLDRFRDRHTVAGAKDDRRDAFVLADSIRTDRPLFRRVEADDPLIVQIRELSRVDEDLREEENRLQNRLRQGIRRTMPHLLELSPSVDEPWFFDLLERVVVAEAKRRPNRSWIRRLLRRHRIRRLDAEHVFEVLAEAPLHVAPGTREAVRTHLRLLLPRLKLVRNQRKECKKELSRLLDEYADEEDSEEGEPSTVDILRSLPGVGLVVTSTLLAEASSALTSGNRAALRTNGGLAPVTRQSGKSKVVLMRYSCNTRLRNAFYHWARTSVQHDEASRRYYAKLRGRGHSHGRALRSVADRWLRILFAMLRDGTTYDPERYARVQQSRAPLPEAA